MSLPGGRRRALDQIEQALVKNDPGLAHRFALFGRLTRHEAIPLTEQLPVRLRQPQRRAMLLPLAVISVAGLFAASLLVSSNGQRCPAAPAAAAHATMPPSRALHCQPNSTETRQPGTDGPRKPRLQPISGNDPATTSPPRRRESGQEEYVYLGPRR